MLSEAQLRTAVFSTLRTAVFSTSHDTNGVVQLAGNLTEHEVRRMRRLGELHSAGDPSKKIPSVTPLYRAAFRTEELYEIYLEGYQSARKISHYLPNGMPVYFPPAYCRMVSWKTPDAEKMAEALWASERTE